MTFEQVLELYLAVEKAYDELPIDKISTDAIEIAVNNYEFALENSDFTDSMFYDYCVAEGLFEY